MTFAELWRPLTAVYDEGEARAVARLVLEERFGLTMTDVLCGRMGDEEELLAVQQRLLKGEPVQYVLGVADFGDKQFHVAPGVLIPRPETYELCQWSISGYPSQWSGDVLDIGTGSGCIACTLAAALPQARVVAWDVSGQALDIARENAKRTGAHVSFKRVDVLTNPPRAEWDLIVSNPPYICEREKESMERHVLDHEPALALFVPDADPLLFYRAIARYAATMLRPDGQLFFEINALYARETEQMLREQGFTEIETRRDQYGKERFIKTVRR